LVIDYYLEIGACYLVLSSQAKASGYLLTPDS